MKKMRIMTGVRAMLDTIKRSKIKVEIVSDDTCKPKRKPRKHNKKKRGY